jgi:formate hydrogenlyase subunit 4
MLERLVHTPSPAFVAVAFVPPVKGVVSGRMGIPQTQSCASSSQSYSDICRLLYRIEIISNRRSRLFRILAHVAFIAPVFVASHIPAPAPYPAVLAFKGDVERGAFIRLLGRFLATSAAVGLAHHPRDPIGASRVKNFLLESAFHHRLSARLVRRQTNESRHGPDRPRKLVLALVPLLGSVPLISCAPITNRS